MSDVDDYVAVQPRQWVVQKQDRFEQRVLLDLLRRLEDKPGLAKRLRFAVGDPFGCAWLANNCTDFPVRLSTFKASKPIATAVLLRNPQKLPIFRELTELADNYPDDHWALVFASDGDGLPEMVIHTRIDWDVEPGYWRIILPEAKMTLEGVDGEIHRRWIIDPLDGFAEALKANSGWRVDESLTGGVE